MSTHDPIEQAIGEWLMRKESEPALLPGEFARDLPAAMRVEFLAELEALASIDGMATMAPPRDLPRRYGDFRMLGELGRGAMGAVFEAEQVSTGRRVALKVMHAHIAGDPQSLSRFRREAKTVASLTHPGIVQVLDFGETAGCAWLAMARIEGWSLQRLIAAHDDVRDVDHAHARKFFADPLRVAEALAGAAEALGFAHRNGVVHRDVKPANLMYTDDGSIVVLDFGLATARESDAATLTRTCDFLGTPLYMAPEQALGARNGTAASDVFALGAVLYECLCGVPPVAPGPLASVIDAILNREPVDPRRRRPGVPAELARIALQCLEKDPRDRYSSADALAADLRRFVAGVEVRARSSSLLRRSLRRWQKRPTSAVLPALALLAVSIAIVVGFVAVRRADENVRLQRHQDLQRIDELLASAPERLTVFGGASARFYARIGLGESPPDPGVGRSSAAAAALDLAEALGARHSGDAEVWRALAMARLDVADDDARTAAVLEHLLACIDARPADRLLAAVWHRQCGREAEAQRLRATVDPADSDPEIGFWLGFWHQDEQDHAAAIAAFTRAIESSELGTERRYWALLHRGWCRTCPDVADFPSAQRDLLQAAALRPRYATASLLLAALQCLDAKKPEDLQEPVRRVQNVLRDAEPWVHVLTARVLLALAEGGTVQAGPVAFGAEFSPIAVMPVAPAFAVAFADLARTLLEGVLTKEPRHFEASLYHTTSLALLGRHGEALAALAPQLAGASKARTATLEVQRARVHLAAGSADRALLAVDRALAVDPDSIAARRIEALAAGHLGDLERRLRALDAAAARLLALPRLVSVFPDAAVVLPEIQLDRARVLHSLGRTDEAVALVRSGDFGGVLAGENGLRVVAQRQALLAAWGDRTFVEDARVVAAVDGSPLRWLHRRDAPQDATSDAVRVATWRGWLPASAFLRPQRTSPGSLLVDLPAALASPTRLDERLATADRLLADDPLHGEARLLRALALHLGGRTRESAEFLARTAAEHEGDLRSRYLLAVAASAIGDRDLLRQALRRRSGTLSARELDLAAALLPLACGPDGTALTAEAQ